MINTTVNIGEEVGLIVAKTAATLGITIHYMWGHPLEIVNQLQLMTESPAHKDQKFPIVCLFTDVPVTRSIVGFYGSAKLQIIIANITRQEYTAPERLANNFKPVLQPIKNELLNQIQVHKQFTYPDEVSFTEIERYFWGKQGLYGNTGNMLNDFIDCIELQNVEVNIKNIPCTTLTNNFN